MWDWIAKSFKSAINMIIGWWDDLHFTMPSFDTHIPGIGKVGGFDVGMPHIPKLASGGIGSGLTRVNEMGGELFNLPTGTVVSPHANAQSAMAGGYGSAGTQRLEIEWVGGNAGDEFMTWLRNNIRIRGGNNKNSVQNVLGQSY
jgi:hypothetical protein